ncbi:MAG: glucokinase [Lysobacterales bacterium]|jgi:glucokinase
MLDHPLARAACAGALATHFIAADVGGTHARVALVETVEGAAPRLHGFRRFTCAEHSDLGALLGQFLHELPANLRGSEPPQQATIACAGYVLDRRLVHANLPWSVDLDQIESDTGLREVRFVNDFEAVAIAVARLQPAAMEAVLAAHGPTAGEAPLLVLGAGTGFGAALCVPTASRLRVLATEAGQAGFAPSSALGLELFSRFRQEQRQVNIEHFLSGPGLLRIYRGLCALHGEAASLDTPAAVSAAGAEHPRAQDAVELFCAELGSVCANLVLSTGALGGVRLAGGVLPHLRPGLLRQGFREHFLDKGAMRAQLERVPVYLVEHGELGVLGAARWHLEQPRSG